MAVYFDTKVKTAQAGINTGLYYHQVHPLLAVSSFDHTAGGTVSLYDKDVSIVRCMHSYLFI